MSAEDTVAGPRALKQRSDAEAIIRTAQEAVDAQPLDPDSGALAFVVPEGSHVEVIDTEKYGDAPHSARGKAQVATVTSLVRYAELVDAKAPTVWIDEDEHRIVVVFNDNGIEAPDWGDHRAELVLKPTAEWLHWLSKDGQMLDQVPFAEHIEAGLPEILVPDAADMLEIAQTISATTDVTFRSGKRLHDGRNQFTYAEEMSAAAGEDGQFEIPKEFELAIAPFVGEDTYRIEARFRFRLDRGHLRLGYSLHRPVDVVRDCLDKIGEKLRQELGNESVFLGKPATARR